MKLLTHSQSPTLALYKFGMDKLFHLTFYDWYNYVSILDLSQTMIVNGEPDI